MSLFKLISHSVHLKKNISLFLLFFLMNNLLIAKADENSYLNTARQEENKFKEFGSHNSIKYKEYDNLDSQLKIFFGFDSDNPQTSFYPDLAIIDYSDYVRDMYKSKLNDMTTYKIIYNGHR